MHLSALRMSAVAALVGVLVSAGPAGALELTERQVVLGPKLTMAAARKAAEKLFKLDAAGEQPIILLIATRSGYAPAAMVVVDAIRAVKAKVHAVVQAEAFAGGALVALFCHRRYAFPHASILFTKLEYDSKKTMEKEPPLPKEAADAYLERVYASAAKRLNMKPDALKAKVEKGWFMNASEAKKVGVIDEVVDRVTWVELVVETVQIKRTSVIKEKRPIPSLKK